VGQNREMTKATSVETHTLAASDQITPKTWKMMAANENPRTFSLKHYYILCVDTVFGYPDWFCARQVYLVSRVYWNKLAV
jgi:hypothetical protein